MRDDFLRYEIAKLFSKYDPDLAANTDLDEFGKILRLVGEGLEGAGIDESLMEAWHSQEGAGKNKYDRAQACLAKAIRDSFGDTYATFDEFGADVPQPIYPKIVRGSLRLLDRAKKGIHLAEVYCCIYFYLKALGELSRYPAVSKITVLKSLMQAKEVFLCPDVFLAMDLVSDLPPAGDLPPDSGDDDSLCRFPVSLRLVLCTAAIIIGGSIAAIWASNNRIDRAASVPVAPHSTEEPSSRQMKPQIEAKTMGTSAGQEPGPKDLPSPVEKPERASNTLDMAPWTDLDVPPATLTEDHEGSRGSQETNRHPAGGVRKRSSGHSRHGNRQSFAPPRANF